MSARNLPMLITNGEVVDDRDMRDHIRSLESKISKLNEYNLQLERELSDIKSQNGRAMSSLRKVLTPLYSSLQQLFGEMDAIDGGQGAATGSVSSGDGSKWEFWKRRYPGRIAEAIDILMLQPMNTKQLSHALKCDPRTLTSKVIYPMNQSGLLNKSGGMFSLKQL